MEVRTVYTPRGSYGVMFVLLSNGKYYKWQPGNKVDSFEPSSEKELLKYKEASENLWWNPFERRWGTIQESLKSFREMKKNSE